MMQKILVVLAVLVLCAVLCAGADLTGTWKCGSSVIEFRGNGPHKLKLGGNTHPFTISGADFVVTEGNKQVKRPFRMADGKLHVTFGDEVRVYRRK